jgi:hypothetical protein
MAMSPVTAMPVTTMVTMGVTIYDVSGSRRAMAWIHYHRGWSASSGDYRRRDHNRRRSDDHRRVRVMIPQRNAEAHTSARVGRSRQRGDCNCTNKE